MRKRRNAMRPLLFLMVLVMISTLMVAPAIPAYAKGSVTKLTEAQYLARVNAFILDKRWKNGVSWTNSNVKHPKSNSKVNGTGCWAYMYDFVKQVYNRTANNGETFNRIENIRAGDIIHYWYYNSSKKDNVQHWVCVISRVGDKLYTAEGSFDGKVRVTYSGYTISSIKAKVNSYNPKCGNKKYPGERFQGWHYLPASLGSISQYFVVKYQAGGGTGSMADTKVPFGKWTALSKNAFIKNGYEFAGWNLYNKTTKCWLHVKKGSKASEPGNFKWTNSKTSPNGYELRVITEGSKLWKEANNWGAVIELHPIWKAVDTSSSGSGSSGSGNSSGESGSGSSTTTPVVVEPASTLKVSNPIAPSGSLAKGAAFTVGGTVTSNYNISSITVSVKNSSGTVQFSKTVNPNAKSYNLFGVDFAMSFSKLPTGSFVYTVAAKDAKKTITYTSNFTVKSSSVTISGYTYPSGTLTKGNTFSIKGTVKDTKAIKNVRISVVTTAGVEKFAASASPNAKSYDIHKLDSKLTFRQLPAGSYIFRIAVTDANGVVKYMVTKSFKVQ